MDKYYLTSQANCLSHCNEGENDVLVLLDIASWKPEIIGYFAGVAKRRVQTILSWFQNGVGDVP